MDCPSEEQLIRAALATVEDVERMEFDLPGRRLRIWHSGEVRELEGPLAKLSLGAKLEESSLAEPGQTPAEEKDQRGLLRMLLLINASMFVVELIAGIVGESTGLLSDALDMFADALVYGIALWAVGKTSSSQRLAARASGWCQMLLALGVASEVLRRAFIGSEPAVPLMLGAAVLALLANITCVLLLARHRDEGVHMRASWIFSTNDVIANVGLIAAAGLVHVTNTAWPDLVIGALVALLVMKGAFRILSLGRA